MRPTNTDNTSSAHPETPVMDSNDICRAELSQPHDRRECFGYIPPNQYDSRTHWRNKFRPTGNIAVSGCTLVDLAVTALPIGFAQFSFEYFTGTGQGQWFLAKGDALGQLVARYKLATMSDQLLLGQ